MLSYYFSEDVRLFLADSLDGTTFSVLLNSKIFRTFANDIRAAIQSRSAVVFEFLSIANADLRFDGLTRFGIGEDGSRGAFAPLHLDQLHFEAVQAATASLRGAIYQIDRPFSVALVRKYSGIVYALKSDPSYLVDPIRITKKLKKWVRTYRYSPVF